MKIAIFTDTYDQINGVSVTFRRLVEYAKKNNKDIEIFTSSNKDSVEIINKNIKINRYKVRVPIKFYPDISFDLVVLNRKLINYFKENKFDLIHVATPASMGINGCYIARRFKIPLIGSYHTELPEYVKAKVDYLARKINWPDKKGVEIWKVTSSAVMWFYLKAFYRKCKVILVPSEDTKKILKNKFKQDIHIFSVGVDYEKFNPKNKNKNFKKRYGKNVNVLYVGRISVEKNLDTLEKCFEDIKDAKLVVVGDGPYKKIMETRVKNAEFLGFKEGKELSEIYASCDFFVFPSKTDTFGNVVLEAMASGLPVIVSNVGGPKELIKNGKTGFICKNVKDFKSKINLLIKNKKLREEMSKNAREYALTRCWGNVFEELFKDYKKFSRS